MADAAPTDPDPNEPKDGFRPFTILGVAAANARTGASDVWHAIAASYKRGGLVVPGGLAFFSILSLAPLLLLGVFVAGLVLGNGWPESSLYESLQGYLGTKTADAVGSWLKAAGDTTVGIPLSLAAVASSLWAASRLFAEARWTLHFLWYDGPIQRHTGIGELVRTQGAALFAAALASTGLAALVFIDWVLPEGSVAAFVADLCGLIGFTVLMAALFRWLPREAPSWRASLWGGFLAAGVFVASRFVIAAYFVFESGPEPIRLAGSVFGALLWMLGNAFAFVWGAQLTRRICAREEDCALNRAEPRDSEERQSEGKEDSGDERDQDAADARRADQMVGPATAEGELTFTLPETDIRRLLSSALPMTVLLDDEDPHRTLTLVPPLRVDLKGSGEVETSFGGRLKWPLPKWLNWAGTPELESVVVGTIVPNTVQQSEGPTLRIKVAIEDVELPWVPKFIRKRIFAIVNAILEDKTIEWVFGNTLSASLKVAGRIQPHSRVEVSVRRGEIDVDDNQLQISAPVGFQLETRKARSADMAVTAPSPADIEEHPPEDAAKAAL